MLKDSIRKFFQARYRVSFSKAGEDIQLYKLLNVNNGRYLDIGCFEPITFSNTYFFYLRKWSGLVVDPNPDLKDLFDKVRPRDTFINNGIGKTPGRLTYYSLPQKLSSMNTFDFGFLEKNNLVNHIEKETKIPVITMQQLLAEYSDSMEIDILDVDVEGLDLEVLMSNNWEQFRPNFVMVETDNSIEEDLACPVYSFLVSKDYSLLSKLVQSTSGAGNLVFVKNEYKKL